MTIEIMLIPPPPLLADFYGRWSIAIKGKYQIFWYHIKFPFFFYREKFQGARRSFFLRNI